MSAIPIPMIPENAPFSSSQRAWLNGFFAALLGARGNGSAAVAPPPQAAPAPAAVVEALAEAERLEAARAEWLEEDGRR